MGDFVKKDQKWGKKGSRIESLEMDKGGKVGDALIEIAHTGHYGGIQSRGMEERKRPRGWLGRFGCPMLINLSFVHIAMLRDSMECLRNGEASIP